MVEVVMKCRSRSHEMTYLARTSLSLASIFSVIIWPVYRPLFWANDSSMTLGRLAQGLVVSESRYTFETNCTKLGVGTFGETVKVQDRVTKGFVVIHKIPTSKFTPQQQDMFREQVTRIVECRHMFVVPVIGYSFDRPALIVTQFEEGGSLQYALRKWNKLRWFNDTARTVIAIGIVTAMQYLLEMGMFHGNLKPSNIMLDRDDDRVVPRVAEFGLAQFSRGRNEDGYDAGDEEFTEKSDVWSFGQILVDMFENRKESGRSKSIEKLISRCSKRNPAQRPTFDQIFEMFESHEVEFPRTNRDEVELVLKQIREQEKRRKRRKFKYLLTITDSFVPDLMSVVSELAERDGIYFFQTLAHNFKPETPHDEFAAMLSVCRKLTETVAFAESFVDAQLHLRLPFDRKDLIDMTFPILLNLVNNNPGCVDEKMANTLGFLLAKHEKKVLRIVSDYARHFNKVENPWPLLDVVLVQWQKVETQQTFFISILYYLCRYFTTYREARAQTIRDIMFKYAKSEDMKVVKGALGFISEFCQDQLPFKHSYITKMLNTPHMPKAMLTVLLCVRKFEITEPLVGTVLSLARSSVRAGMLLTKLADTKKGASILMKMLEFMENQLPDYRSTFRTVLVLAQTEKYRQVIVNTESLAILMSELSKSPSISDLVSVVDFALLVPLSSEMIKLLNAYGFFSINSRADFTDNKRYAPIWFSLLAKCALREDLPIYSTVIRKCASIVQRQKKSRRDLLRFLTSVSRFPGYADALHDLNVPTLFASFVESHPHYQKQVDIITQNSKAYRQQNRRKEQKPVIVPPPVEEEEEEESIEASESDSYGYFMSGTV